LNADYFAGLIEDRPDVLADLLEGQRTPTR